MKFSKDLIAEELNTFEQKFSESVKSNTPLLDRIMKYIIKRKGKQLRPMFVFLSAKLHGNLLTELQHWLNYYIQLRWCMTM